MTKTIEEYISGIPADKAEILTKLRRVINDNIPSGFAETFDSKMIHYVVPHSLYPPGYHCNPKQPLPFISIAAQKNNVSMYHMGLYADKSLLDWFTSEYPKHSKRKLDMGKSCIRFKKYEDVPFGLLGELCSKITPERWISIYEEIIKK